MKTSLFAVAVVCFGALSSSIGASEPVKRVPVYVTPYYSSAKEDGGTPEVNVGRRFDPLLRSNKREDILAARDLVEAEPQRVTPMTMMVLAIRLYDVGMRDDAVFWFYVAKERALAMNEVLDMKSAELFEVGQAIIAFASLAGETINGYAFCDLAKQKAAKEKAMRWSEEHEFETLFLPALPAKPGDRHDNLKRAIESARERTRKEQEYFADPKNVESFKQARIKNEADVKYCWEAEDDGNARP